MQNLELKARVTKVFSELVDVNTFKYRLVNIQVGQVDEFPALVSIFHSVEVGDCFVTSRWKVTRIGKETRPVNLCIRIDYLEVIPSDGFEVSEYLNSIVYGTFVSSEKCYLKTVGPDRKPFFNATLKLEDSDGESFGMLLIAFNSNAKHLSTVKSHSNLKCEVSIKKRRHDPGYELTIIRFTVIKEA